MPPDRVRILSVIVLAALLTLARTQGRTAHAHAVDGQDPPSLPLAELVIIPDSIALAPGEKAPVLILISFPATAVPVSKTIGAPIESVTRTVPTTLAPVAVMAGSHTPAIVNLSCFTDTGVKVNPSCDVTQTMPVYGGDLYWEVEIAAPENGVSPGPLYFVADYTTVDADGRFVTRTLTATLDITQRAAESIADVLSTTLHSDITKLFDLRQRNAILVVTNVGNVPVTITSIEPTLTSAYADQLTAVVVDKPPLPVTLLPQQAKEFLINLRVGSAIEAGSNVLVVRTDAEWLDRQQKGSTLVTTSFESAVFGESAILNAVGVPVLLLLPGTIVVVGFYIFRRVVHRIAFAIFGQEPDKELPAPSWLSWKGDPGITDPKNVIWAITASLVIFICYPTISGIYLSLTTGVRQTGRNLLMGYGFIDVVILWLAALAVALICAISANGSTIRSIWKRRKSQCQLKVADVLERLLHNHNLDFVVEKRNYQDGSVYLLPGESPLPENVWVTPGIQVATGDKYDSVDISGKYSVRVKVERLISDMKTGNAQERLPELMRLERDGWLKLVFITTGKLKEPTLVKEQDLSQDGPAGTILDDTMTFQSS